jgi:outer membrane receptor protein involved in Fe transport
LTEATFRQLTQFDSRNIVNAQLRAELNNEVSISLWGKNIFEDKYWNHGAAFAPFGYPIAPSFVGEPRTVGATVTTRF